MAGYREHISVSGLLGIAYAFAAIFVFAYSPVQAAIAAVLTWIAGMLPDLDSESGRPVRELSHVTAALAPLLLLQHTQALGMGEDRAMLFCLLVYAAVRYGGAAILGKLTVHRGMFHSIPALLIAAEVTFLAYRSDDVRVRLLMGVGVGIGFLSHLVLDEMYSVQWDGLRIKLSRSAGSALKFFGSRAVPNGVAMGMLIFLTYATLVQAGLMKPPGTEAAPDVVEVNSDLADAPRFRVADQPTDTQRH
jgi:LexA-binding, inner membrane-associated putative hydrolase